MYIDIVEEMSHTNNFTMHKHTKYMTMSSTILSHVIYELISIIIFHPMSHTMSHPKKKINAQQQQQQLGSRFADYEEEVAAPRVPVQNQDYRNFFDFGYFSDLAASFANAPHPSTQTGNAITIRKQKGPNTVELEKLVIPNSPQKDASGRVDEFF